MLRGPNDISPQRIAGYTASGIAAGLLIAVAGHYLGRITWSSPPVEEKRMAKHRPARPHLTQAQILDAQQPLDAYIEPAAAPPPKPAEDQ